MSQTLNCPHCGAPLDYTGGPDLTIICPYCRTSVIVPDELRRPPGTPRPSALKQAQGMGEIAYLARTGKKIEAIKLYRESFGGGLKEAKDAVEAIAVNKEIIASQVVPKTTSGASGTGFNSCVVIGGLVIALLAVFGVIFVASFPSGGVPLVSWAPTATSLRMATATRMAEPTRVPTLSPVPTVAKANVLLRFGGQGTGPGLFNRPNSLALDPSGNIFVADWQGGRVQVFDSAGQFVHQWFVGNSKTTISSLAADLKGNLYVVADGRILRCDGATGKVSGPLAYPEGDRFYRVAAGPDGGLIATWYEEREGIITSIKGHRDDLVRFDGAGQVTQVVRGIISDQTGDPEGDNRPALDGLGNLYIAGGDFEPAVYKFTPEFKFVTRIGSKGEAPGQFSSLRAIAVDNQGRIFVADSRRVQVFESNGRYLDQFQVDEAPNTMVFNDKNELFVLTSAQVLKIGIPLR